MPRSEDPIPHAVFDFTALIPGLVQRPSSKMDRNLPRQRHAERLRARVYLRGRWDRGCGNLDAIRFALVAKRSREWWPARNIHVRNRTSAQAAADLPRPFTNQQHITMKAPR